MQVYKEGIEKTIRDTEWQTYRNMGFVQVKAKEEQPAQEDVVIVDDYTISKPKVKAKKVKGK